MLFNVRNPGSGLGQAHKCGRVKPDPNPRILITGSPKEIHQYRYKQGGILLLKNGKFAQAKIRRKLSCLQSNS